MSLCFWQLQNEETVMLLRAKRFEGGLKIIFQPVAFVISEKHLC